MEAAVVVVAVVAKLEVRVTEKQKSRWQRSTSSRSWCPRFSFHQQQSKVAAVVEAVARQRCGRLRQSESHYAPPEPPSMKLMMKQT